ncbi:hypothetical protein BOSE21B_111305 [Bosea sp. 21B]|nr:hypothetical protein BOSE21B_111305 [Bosea sp. 21B]VXC68814.1 hypothetical protein BOSE127_40088 [Bosea sp. 127]
MKLNPSLTFSLETASPVSLQNKLTATGPKGQIRG